MIEPDPEDFEAIKLKYGELPRTASDEQRAHHYRLAQAQKLVRSLRSAEDAPQPRRKTSKR